MIRLARSTISHKSFLRRAAVVAVVLALVVVCAAVAQAAEPKFALPEFKGGYQRPPIEAPSPRPMIFDYVDVAALVLALGVGWWLSAFDGLYKDVRHILPFVTQLWFFASPIAYPASLVPADWRWVYGLNPIAGIIDVVRWALLGTPPPDTGLLLTAIATTLLVALSGLIVFRRAERALADRL